jgi:hypothetical protein
MITGPTGSMKTNTALNILHQMENTFEHLIICCQTKYEPLYEYLEKKIPEGMLTFFENGEIPNIRELEGCGQTLIIFDDLVLNKDQHDIAEYMIRGRKVGDGISMCYLTQSYFKTPKIIRLQCNYLILKKLNDVNDLRMILQEQPVCCDLKEMKKHYNKSQQKQEDFFMLDFQTMDDDYKIRRNFQPISKRKKNNCKKI